jgi:hypothetical protein
MPATLRVIEDGRALYFTYSDPWTLEEANQLNAQAEQLYETASQPLITVIDLRKMRSIPVGALNVRFYAQLMHPKAGKMIVLGANSVIRTTGQMLLNLVRFGNVTFVDTEAALHETLDTALATQATE